MKHKHKKIKRKERKNIDVIVSLWDNIINEYKENSRSYYQKQSVKFGELVTKFQECLFEVSNFSFLFFIIKEKYNNHKYYVLCWKNILNNEKLVVDIISGINQPCLEAQIVTYYLCFAYNLYNHKMKSVYWYERLNVHMNSTNSLSLIPNECYMNFENINDILNMSSNKLSIIKEILGSKYEFIVDEEGKFFDKLMLLCYKYLDLKSVNYGIWFYNAINRVEYGLYKESADIEEFKNLNEVFLRFFPNNYIRDWWRTERYNIEKEKTVKYIYEQFSNLYKYKLYETIFFVKKTTEIFNVPVCLIKGISEFLIEPFRIYFFDDDHWRYCDYDSD